MLGSSNYVCPFASIVFKDQINMSFHGNQLNGDIVANFLLKCSIDIPNGTKWNISEGF